MSAFIERFSTVLANSGKKQIEICKELGISKQKLSNWKTGYSEPNLDDIVMLAVFFDIRTDYLLGLEDETGAKVRP